MTRPEAFLELIQNHEGLINKVVFLYALDQEDKADLRQEILSQAWAGYARFRGEARFSTWLYRLAMNVAITRINKKKKHQQPLDSTVLATAQGSEVEGKELLQAVLAVLNPIEKSLVLLQVEGYDQQEIAEFLGISHANVRTKIHRIRKKLKSYGIDRIA